MNNRRRLTGVVTSNKMDKTAVVEISRTYRHKLYQKVVHSFKRVMVHDELGCEVGDKVLIVESRPISRHKHWVVAEILHRDIAAGEPEVILEEREVAEQILKQPELSEETEEESRLSAGKSEEVEDSDGQSNESEQVEEIDMEGEE
jgi:small subunit ribosomal protein S17